MKVIKLAFLAIFLCAATKIYSQTDQSVLRQVSPLTPNAASFAKYGETPVSLYTGIPNINIPMYEIKVGGFVLPISLSYHAGGVQVDDVPSWVGTGWTLNAGGVLNCRMRGVEDYRMLQLFDDEDVSSAVATILDPSASEFDKIEAAEVLRDRRYDTEADIYSISTGTLSHKFFLDIDGNAHGMPERKLKIVYEGTVERNQGNHVYFARWRVTDESGVEYIFGRTLDNSSNDYEITRNELFCGAASGDREFVNTWYLNEIKLPDGESIKFNYEYFTFCRGNIVGQGYSTAAQALTLWETSTNYIQALRIKDITFPTGKVAFVSGDLRRDVPNDSVLEYVEIYAKRYGNYVKEKSFRLETNNPVNNTTSNDESFRLTLLSVTELDKDGTSLTPYRFKYNDDNNSYTMGLPARKNYAQDLWGFYNGKSSNQSLFPSQYRLYGDRWGPANGGADRSVSTVHAQRGILTEITYPTGGTTQFFYESNTTKGIANEDPNLTWGNWTIIPDPFVNPVYELVEMKAIETGPEQAFVEVENISGTDSGESTFFIVGTEDTQVSVALDVLYAGVNRCAVTTPGGPSGLLDCLDITIYKKVGGVFVPSINDVYFNHSYPLAPGEYRVNVEWVNAPLPNEEPTLKYARARVLLTWRQEIIPDLDGDFVVGGLRIAKIVDKDGSGGPDVVRWFNYDYDETVSGAPPYSGSSGIIQNTCMRFYGGSLVIKSSASTLQTGGGYVGYRKVAVTYGADKKGGKQVTYFTSAVDYPDGNLAISKQLASEYEPVEVDWRRGLPLRVVDLKYENNSYQVVRESEKKYTLLKEEDDPNNYHHVNIRINPDASGSATFKTVSESFYMHESIEREKSSQGEMVTTTSYEQNIQNLAVSKTTTQNSNGDLVEVTTKYPVDYADVENIGVLKAGNFISLPVKIETTKNSKLTDGTAVKYTNLGQPATIYRYESVDLVEAPSHNNTIVVPPDYMLKSQFKYNALGNKLLESKPSNSYSTTYIWGYDRSFPVIKIENMSDEEIPSSLISAIEAHIFSGSTDITDLQDDVDFLNTQVNSLRANKKYRVTTYTYHTSFGLTSQTDQNGITAYFEYDSYGRLNQVRDDNMNIVKSYKYHYKGQ